MEIHDLQCLNEAMSITSTTEVHDSVTAKIPRSESALDYFPSNCLQFPFLADAA